jgi:sugar phosphate isomerase/epimerase
MIPIGMSTSCVYPQGVETGFRVARLAGYDGIEVMVTRDPGTRSSDELLRLRDTYSMPILAIHAPVLLLTSNVWGRDPRVKLLRSAQLAAAVGARNVVVHPPFRWQAGYATGFERIVRETADETGVEVCVENMFPWKIGGRQLKAYAPSPYPLDLDVDAMTLDFSHAALSGRDSLELAMAMGDRLRHVHLCDGRRSASEGNMFDEHLAPGRGTQPVAETLQYLAANDWDGVVVAEVVTHKFRNTRKKMDLLVEAVAFAREHLEQDHSVREPLPVPGGGEFTRRRVRRAERRAERG